MLAAQAIGSLTITLAIFSVSLAVMYAVNAIDILRVSREGEALGLDLHEHGISAYQEYVIAATLRPAGMVAGEGARAAGIQRTAELGTEPAH